MKKIDQLRRRFNKLSKSRQRRRVINGLYVDDEGKVLKKNFIADIGEFLNHINEKAAANPPPHILKKMQERNIEWKP